MEIHYWWVGLACLLMALSKGAHAASVEPTREHGFDLGQLRCCARPKDSDICPHISDYIPCTIANDMERRENRIGEVVATHAKTDSIDANCSDSIRDVLCEQSFPTCVINPDGSHEVQLPARSTCEVRLEEACEEELRGINRFDQNLEEICSLYEPTSTNYSVGNCSGSNVVLNHCTVDWYLPAWLHQYVKQIDLELDNALRDGVFTSQDRSCGDKVKNVRCKSVGRCWAQGDRLEHIISIETCNEALSCLNDDVQRSYRSKLGCEFFPGENSRVATSPTDITLTPPTTQHPSVTTSTTTTKSSFPTHPLPGELTDSTSISSASISLLLLTLTISLLVR